MERSFRPEHADVEADLDLLDELLPAPGRRPLVAEGSTARDLARRILARLGASLGAGTDLPSALRARFEAALGVDLGAVRLHADAGAAAAASAFGARAFAVGQDVFFDGGELDPGTPEGQRLLAHEVVHTVQQRGAAPGSGGVAPTRAGDAAETEADEVAGALLAGAPLARSVSAAPLALAGEWRRGQPLPDQSDQPAAPGEEVTTLNRGEGNLPVRLYHFPRRDHSHSNQVVLIVGGIHGNEHAGVEVVDIILEHLRGGFAPAHEVYVLPTLFPENIASGHRTSPDPSAPPPAPGRRRSDNGPDPNRDLPNGPAHPQPALRGNQILVSVIERIQPTRIVQLHGTTNQRHAGFTRDVPGERPADFGAGATDDDAQRVRNMAQEMRDRGQHDMVAGNRGGAVEWRGAANDPDEEGSGDGVSLGEYATQRGMSVITVETRGNPASHERASEDTLRSSRTELMDLALVIEEFILGAPRQRQQRGRRRQQAQQAQPPRTVRRSPSGTPRRALQLVLERDDQQRPTRADHTFTVGTLPELRTAVAEFVCSISPAPHHERLRQEVNRHRQLGTLARHRAGQQLRLMFTFAWNERGLASFDLSASLGAYNAEATEEGDPPVDPERPTEPRLAPDGRWDGRVISRNWTQLDGHAGSFNDAYRCGYVAQLIVHINAGFDAVRRVAAQTGTQLEAATARPGFDAQSRTFAEMRASDATRMSTRRMAEWRYHDLDLLAEALYLLGERGRVAATPDGDTAGRVAGVGTEGVASNGTRGPEAAEPLRRRVGNRYEGMNDAVRIVADLGRYRHVGYTISVSSLAVSRNQGGHAITLGVDGDGVIYLYDPWPRRGRQQLFWSSNRAEIEPYFTGAWEVSTLVVGATEAVQRRPAQRSSLGGAPAGDDPQAIAATGFGGGGGAIPRADEIQRAFGRHDVSGVRAHVGGAAAEAAAALGARAYASGDDVAFAHEPDLYLIAHEVAHVVQQRAGVDLGGGVGQDGDAHEQHADAVAERVVRGESAEDLLDAYAGGAGVGPPAATQRQMIQFERRVGPTSPESVAIVQQVASTDNIAAMRALLRGLQQTALRRRTPGVPDHVVCVGGGDTFDLQLTAEDSHQAQEMLQTRMAQLEEDGQASAVERGREPQSRPEDDVPMSGGSPFAAGFNREFADILPSLRASGRTASGAGEEARSPELTDQELNLMFSPQQRALLTRYFGDHVIPDRLFNGDGSGGANAQQRIAISGHILSHGTYREGSFSQGLHARYCGHFTQLVEIYAGVAPDRGAGVYSQFDHSGEQTLASGRAHTEFEGDREAVGPGHRGAESRRQFRRGGLSIEEFGRIQPGDWLYLFTDTNTPGGDHSVIFSHWVDTEPRTADGIRYQRAVIFQQPSQDRGGQQSTWQLGEDRGSANGSPVYPVTRISRHDAGDRPPETGDDLIEHELGLQQPDPEQRRQELLPELGTGPSAQANFRTIMQEERRHHGRLNLAWLRQWLREQNAALIAELDRVTDGQRALFADANERDDLETLTRLNERLHSRSRNAEALDEEEQEDRAEIEPRHAEAEAANAAREREIQDELAQLGPEITRASEVLDLDSRIRDLTREQRRRERHLRWLEPRIPRIRNGDTKARLEARRRRYVARVQEIETTLAELEPRRAGAAAAEESGRHAEGLGRGINMRQRVARLRARQDRLLDELEALDASAGYYTAHPGSRDLLIGRRRGEHGEPARRERVTGRLSSLRPQPPWAELIAAGQPGSAQAAQQQRREAARAERAQRRAGRRRR